MKEVELNRRVQSDRKWLLRLGLLLNRETGRSSALWRRIMRRNTKWNRWTSLTNRMLKINRPE